MLKVSIELVHKPTDQVKDKAINIIILLFWLFSEETSTGTYIICAAHQQFF